MRAEWTVNWNIWTQWGLCWLCSLFVIQMFLSKVGTAGTLCIKGHPACRPSCLVNMHLADGCRSKAQPTGLSLFVDWPVFKNVSTHMFQNVCIVAMCQVSTVPAYTTKSKWASIRTVSVGINLANETSLTFKLDTMLDLKWDIQQNIPLGSWYGKYSDCFTFGILWWSSGNISPHDGDKICTWKKVSCLPCWTKMDIDQSPYNICTDWIEFAIWPTPVMLWILGWMLFRQCIPLQ